MKIIQQSAELLYYTPDPLAKIKEAGATAWQSEPKKSAEDFVKMLLDKGHESVLEHVSATMRIITSRDMTHALVRHRAGWSYTQESTHYCNYANGRLGEDIIFIEPPRATLDWANACGFAERQYKEIIGGGGKPQDARTVLPGSVKTTLIATGNMRAWRHLINLRLHTPGDTGQMRILMLLVQQALLKWAPVWLWEAKNGNM